VHRTNHLADETNGVLRISMDTKATIKIGPYSRGGYSRCGILGMDHDFKSNCLLKLFGIHIPALDENYMYFTESHATPDFMIDSLASLWPSLKMRFNPHTLVINLDNGPENNSRRSQFIKRLLEFGRMESINISLVYYPPYHSKYNPIERVWGVLENHWKGELLDSIEKVLGLCRTMTWKGKNPVVNFVKGVYPTGVRLAKSAMDKLEDFLIRIPGIEKWAVDITCYQH
jgi:transposase